MVIKRGVCALNVTAFHWQGKLPFQSPASAKFYCQFFYTYLPVLQSLKVTPFLYFKIIIRWAFFCVSAVSSVPLTDSKLLRNDNIVLAIAQSFPAHLLLQNLPLSPLAISYTNMLIYLASFKVPWRKGEILPRATT